PSSWCVCQFRHHRKNLECYCRSGRIRMAIEEHASLSIPIVLQSSTKSNKNSMAPFGKPKLPAHANIRASDSVMQAVAQPAVDLPGVAVREPARRALAPEQPASWLVCSGCKLPSYLAPPNDPSAVPGPLRRP